MLLVIARIAVIVHFSLEYIFPSSTFFQPTPSGFPAKADDAGDLSQKIVRKEDAEGLVEYDGPCVAGVTGVAGVS